MDREALVIRNQRMAEAFHQLPLKHYVRRIMLRAIASLPINRQRRTEDTRQRILLVRPDHLGDILLTTPAIRLMRQAAPELEIHALVGPWSANILSNSPDVDRVLTLPFPGFSRTPNPDLRSPYRLALSSARHLRQIGYDAAIIFRPDHWWGAMLVHLAGIPQRIGYNHTDVAPFLNTIIEQHHEHVVMQNIRLVERWIGDVDISRVKLHFETRDSDSAYIQQQLQSAGIDSDKPIICIHPGSGTWIKRWDEAKWARVADTLSEQLNSTVVFTGGDHERNIVNTIVSNMQQNAHVMVGETDIHQLAALFQQALVVLGPDSGPLHLASAVGTPTVTLFGPADPVEFGTWGSSARHVILASDIACRPCRVLDWGADNPEYHPCMREIEVGQVLESARRVVQSP